MKIYTRFFKFQLLISALFLATTVVFSQQQPVFNNTPGATLLPGSPPAETIGAKYIFQNVEISDDGLLVDAIFTIVDIVDASLENVDAINGLEARFEPTNLITVVGGYVEWQLEFVLDGTVTNASDIGVKARLDSFTMEAIDVDGQEFFEAIVTNSYTLEGGTTPPTELVVSQNGAYTRFQSGTSFAAGIDEADTEYVVRINYSNVSTVNFRNGRQVASATNVRQNSISFLGEVTFDTEDTTVVNQAPVVLDNFGNSIVQGQMFTGNVLTGASDPDNNEDFTTIKLVDPNDPTNVGFPGSPLVIPGEGTYTVDSTGNVIFTPLPAFTGVTTVLFTIEDDLGVESNQGILEITVLPDGDGDGLEDSADDDDDNDGILDINEQAIIDCTLEVVPSFGAAQGPNNYLGSDITNPTVGDSYLYNDVYAGVDAIVTIVSSNDTAILDLDVLGTTTGVDSFFQPRINHASATSFTEFRIDFVVADTTTPASGVDYTITAIDNDVFEFITFANGYTNNVLVDAPTNEVLYTGNPANAGGFDVGYVSDGTFVAGIAVNTPQYQTAATYSNVSSFSFRFGDTSSNTSNHSIAIEPCIPEDNWVSDPVFYSEMDTDGDGTPDHLDLDSDNDGCFDAVESGGNDPDSDGIIGEAPYTFDGNGLVTGTNVTGGYDGVNGNEIEAVQVNINTVPTDQTEDSGDSGSFTIDATADSATSYTTGTPNYGTPGNANAGINYQWYIGDPDSGGIIIDGTDTNYTNFTTATLDIDDVSGLDGTQYCVLITHDDNVCTREINCATLTINNPCNITDITSSNETTCNDNGTLDDVMDDTFTADITITFVNNPGTGTLDLTGDGSATVDVTSLDTPTSHTFIAVVLPANGVDISLTATFSDNTSCTFTNTSVVTAPNECSDDACFDIVQGGNPMSAIDGANVTFNFAPGTDLNDATSPAELNSITIAGQPNPFTGIYRPNQANYQFGNPGATRQYIRDQTVATANITQGPVIFNPALLAANYENDLRHYLSLDTNINATDFVDFIYNSAIKSASNRYVVITERDGNNDITVEALDASLNTFGTAVVANPTTYIDTGVITDFSQNVHLTIYPLTALVPAGTDIQGIKVTQSGAAGSDGGDGKVFILYDTAFLSPPPTIEPSTAAVQPVCPDNEGSITIDATDNGGGTIEYSVNGLAGPWQVSNVFNNLPPGTYTPAVRYQATPDCNEVSSSDIELVSALCPSIEAVKTVAITNDVGPVGASLGDTVEYTITVTNTGNVTLDGVGIVDTFLDANGNPLTLLTGPTFQGPSSLGSAEGDLLVGEVATYTATYVIEQDAVDAGGFSNSVLADGDSPADTNVDDTSDDDDDTDGNTEDDPTETIIVADPSISLLKTTLPLVDSNGDGVAGGIDDVISYVFVVENTGNVTLTNIIVEDLLPNLNLMGGPITQLIPGEIDSTTFTATYQITQDDIDAGSVINSATVSGEGPDGDLGDPTDDVTDTSDDPNNPDNVDNNGDDDPDDPTVTEVNAFFDLEVTKVVDELRPVVGANVTFTIEVANIGNVTATDIIISEQIPSGFAFVSAITTAGTYSEFDGEWTIALLNPDQVEILQITVEVLGIGDYANTASVQSAAGGNDINPNNDAETVVVDPICLTIYNEFSPDGDGVNETFTIDCLERFTNNKLEVYNRWGNIVYSKRGYLNDWDGTSNGRAVINESDKLPVGTYYYVLDLGDGSEPRVGWLYINRKN